MTFFETMIDRNVTFAETAFDASLKMLPSTGTIIVGCVDPRVDPVDVLGLEQGEAVVIRNVGGRVNKPLMEMLGILRVVAKANGKENGVRNLVLLQHTDCGIIGCHRHAPDLLARNLNVDEDQLAGMAIEDPYAGLAHDLARLKANSQLPSDIVVSGIVYDVGTGLVETVLRPAPLRSPE